MNCPGGSSTGRLHQGFSSPGNPTQPCPNPEQQRKLASLDLYYNQWPEPAIIYVRCGFALKPGTDRVSRHLGEKHNVPKQLRYGLNQLVQSLGLPDPAGLRPRPDWSEPHPYLAQHAGYCCVHCNTRSTSFEVTLRHMSKVHASSMRPKHHHRQLEHVQSDLLFQSWINDIQHSWIVHSVRYQGGSSAGASNPGRLPLRSADESARAFTEKIAEEEHGHLRGQIRAARRIAPQAPTQPALLTNWMRRTGWEALFSNGYGDALVALTGCRIIGATGPGHCGYNPMIRKLFDRCADTVRHTDVSVRRWLRGSLPDRSYRLPFELVTTARTEKLYRGEMKRFLCFWLRLSRLSRGNVAAITGRVISKRQALSLEEIWSDDIWGSKVAGDTPPDLLGGGYYNDQLREYPSDGGINEEEAEEDEVDDEEEENEEEEGQEEEGEEGEEDKKRADEVSPSTPTYDPAADLILRFFSYAAMEEFEDSKSSSSLLVYFSAVRGLSTPDGDELLRPHRFTPVLARLIYCVRRLSV
ncbi:hypothetical protein FLONG3_10653 [Fusarium longipes]|uniref:Uncharacterized protein n=1 Tax=Fusarium longipes TaxID=694270 RepID=A0A395RLP6_9HYPO|nr:hypothetical protein FLONG3_10653 [Fusarium longipes]